MKVKKKRKTIQFFILHKCENHYTTEMMVAFIISQAFYKAQLTHIKERKYRSIHRYKLILSGW